MKLSDQSLEEILGGLVPDWVLKRKGEVRIDNWRERHWLQRARGVGDGVSKQWTNDYHSKTDDCAVLSSCWHSDERAHWFREGGSWPVGGIDAGAELATFEGVGIFTPSAAGPTIKAFRPLFSSHRGHHHNLQGQQMVHGGAIASMLDACLGQTNLLNGTGRAVTAHLEVSTLLTVTVTLTLGTQP